MLQAMSNDETGSLKGVFAL